MTGWIVAVLLVIAFGLQVQITKRQQAGKAHSWPLWWTSLSCALGAFGLMGWWAVGFIVVGIAFQARMNSMREEGKPQYWPLWWGSALSALAAFVFLAPAFFRFVERYDEIQGERRAAELRADAPPLGAPEAQQSTDRGEAIIACEQQARRLASFPETVDFAWLSAHVRYDGDGSATVFTTFRARNAFNVPERFHITCTVEPTGRVEAAIMPAS